MGIEGVHAHAPSIPVANLAPYEIEVQHIAVLSCINIYRYAVALLATQAFNIPGRTLQDETELK